MKNSPSNTLGTAVVLATLSTGTGCGTEVREEEACKGEKDAIPEDLQGVTPTVTDLGHEMAEDDIIRVFFDGQPFDPTKVPGFEETCTAWPLVVELRAKVLKIAENGQSTVNNVTISSKEIWQPGDDSVDGAVPGNVVLSYVLEVKKQIQSKEGDTVIYPLYATPSTVVYDLGPGEDPTGEKQGSPTTPKNDTGANY